MTKKFSMGYVTSEKNKVLVTILIFLLLYVFLLVMWFFQLVIKVSIYCNHFVNGSVHKGSEPPTNNMVD